MSIFFSWFMENESDRGTNKSRESLRFISHESRETLILYTYNTFNKGPFLHSPRKSYNFQIPEVIGT